MLDRDDRSRRSGLDDYLVVVLKLVVDLTGSPLAAVTDKVPGNEPTMFAAVNRTTTLHEPFAARLAQVVERTL